MAEKNVTFKKGIFLKELKKADYLHLKWLLNN